MDKLYAEKLELHYFFGDGSHSMDAAVRNACEKELLALFKECSRILGIDAHVESEAFAEGGLREIWNFFGSTQVATLLVITTIVLSRYPPTDEAKNAAEAELRELQIEESRLNIAKLRADLKSEQFPSEASPALVKIADEVAKSSKVIVRRSNFYEKVDQYQKVEGVSYRRLSQAGEPKDEELPVKRMHFGLFIVRSKKLDPIVIDEAGVEIVAPVLNGGDFKWKGKFGGEPINFSMADSNFRYQVQSGDVAFHNRSVIICVLEIHRELNEAGEIVVTGYRVPTVMQFGDSLQAIETSQGKTYKQAKVYLEGQEDMFLNTDATENITLDSLKLRLSLNSFN